MNKLLYILLVISLTSCFEDRIDIDLNEENQKVVITSWITDLDEPQWVTVGRTVNYLGEISQEYVSDATVKIDVASEEYLLEEGEDGRYFLPESWAAQLGETYTLTVVVEGNEYTASHQMRACPTIDNLDFEEYDFDDLENEEENNDSIHIYGTLFDFQEAQGEGDAYYLIDYHKGTTDGDSLRNAVFFEDSFVDGEYFEGITISEFGRLYGIGDTAVVEMYSIGEETANYLYDIESEIFRGGPFDPPPANVRTNLTGGAVGYFIISGSQQVEIVIE